MPALTEHVFHSPKPDIKLYAKLNAAEEPLVNAKKEIIYLNAEKERNTKQKIKFIIMQPI